MGYDLVFADASEASDPSRAVGGASKGTGERILFANIPTEYKVYALYYPGTMRSQGAAEDALRELGESTGANLFVNIGALGDPQYDWIAKKFEINNWPVVIVTGAAALASSEGENLTAYAKLDDKKLLSSKEKTAECVRELYNLFIRGEVAQAVARAKGMQRAEKIRSIVDFLARALKPVGTYLAGLEFSFSLVEGKLEVKGSRSASV